MTTWAIFGGSFDPPHVGHVLSASWVLATQPVDALLVVPVLEHAFGKGLSSFPHRRRMAELAFADLRRVRVTDLEARGGKPSYTVRTLRELRARHPSVELRLIVGSDLVDQIPSWREGERIGELAPPIVVGRRGHEGSEEVLMPEVSSTEVRRRLRANEPVDELVPRRVARYIRRFGLYRGSEERGSS